MRNAPRLCCSKSSPWDGTRAGRRQPHSGRIRQRQALSRVLVHERGDWRWVRDTAMAGRCKGRPELAIRPLPLEVRLAAIPCRSGETFLRKLFAPLGSEMLTGEMAQYPVDMGLGEVWSPEDCQQEVLFVCHSNNDRTPAPSSATVNSPATRRRPTCGRCANAARRGSIVEPRYRRMAEGKPRGRKILFPGH
jgi:hypothetical protein